MMINIVYLKPAIKSLEKYDLITRKRIIGCIDKIPQGDIKKLKGENHSPLYRLRIGKYRVIYHIESAGIVIVDVDTRGDIYK